MFHKDQFLDLYVLLVVYIVSFSPVIEKYSVLPHSYADDSQFQKSSPPYQIPDLLSMQKCLEDVKTWMTANKLKLNDVKTEATTVSSGRKSRSLFSSFPNSRTISVVHLFHV